MLDYSDKVKDHFFNPRNVGVLPNADAVGEVGTIASGDALKLMLKIDLTTQVITDARFQTFGGGSAIASSSALTEMIIGKTIDEALTITDADIVAFLDGLPQEEMHCSAMGSEVLRVAIASYRGGARRDDHDENASQTFKNSPRNNGAPNGAAKPAAAALNGKASTIRPGHHAAPAGGVGKVTTLQKIKLIEKAVEELRPFLQQDGGDCELVDIDDNCVLVRLSGACVGCQAASVTIAGVQERLVQKLGLPLRVVPVR